MEDTSLTLEHYKKQVKEHIDELNNILREIAANNFTVHIPTLDEQDSFAELYYGIQLTADDIQYTVTKLNKLTEELAQAKNTLEDEVRKRTAELEEKVKELSLLNKAMTGREIRMIELKEQIKKLETQLANTHS